MSVNVDPVGNLLSTTTSPLDGFFHPKSVAVIGASEKEGSVGRTVFWNLVSSPFGGVVYPVNSQRSSIMGVRAYPKLSALPEVVDLVVICTPAASVPGLVEEAGALGVKATIIISAGFKELGPPGIELEQQILKSSRQYGMRIVGPNCLGLMNPLSGLNATFAGEIARPGKVAFISQSGALCTAILDWSLTEAVGFSAFVSIGSMLDVDWGDLIQYFGDDPRTESIVIYMESIGSARSFLSAAREVALKKPIIVIKAGRSDEAAKAAASHTGALTGSDEVLDAAFRRVGVLRVSRIADLFYMAEVLGKQPLPKGRRLCIVTNAGGPGVLATDALVEGGGQLALLSSEAFQQLNEFLPPHWSRSNPVDILGDAGAERYAKALQVVSKNEDTDGTLVILTPQDMSDGTQTAEKLKAFAHESGKPVLASWMGGADVQAGIDILNKANIPTFPYPDSAVRAFNYMWQYNENLRALYETPEQSAEGFEPDRDGAATIIDAADKEGRTLLTETESKKLLACYGIPVVPTEVAISAQEAVSLAGKIGFPVALKLFSTTITHKTDVGGVVLDIYDAEGVESAFRGIKERVTKHSDASHFRGVTVQPMLNLREGYEIIIGSSIDAQFGPVVLFGLGGQLVEVFKDRALALPPLNRTLARDVIQRTKIATALKGVRGRSPVNFQLLEDILVRFAQLVVEQKRLRECDINPLFASSERLIALDGRFVLWDRKTEADKIPATAIRPYPVQYEEQKRLKDGEKIIIRPIRPEDESALITFHGKLSEQSVVQRYGQQFNFSERTTHSRLVQICFTDYDRNITLVATPLNKPQEVMGVARLLRRPNSKTAVLTLVVADPFQRLGIGSSLVQSMLRVAASEHLSGIEALILRENKPMQSLLSRLGFKEQPSPDERFTRVTVEIASLSQSFVG